MSIVGDSFRDYQRTLASSPIIPTRILPTPVTPSRTPEVVRRSDIMIMPIEKPLSYEPLLKRKELHDQARNKLLGIKDQIIMIYSV